MISDDERALQERRRIWERNLHANGLQSPDGDGTISSGAYQQWLLLTLRLFEHRSITLDEMDDDMRKIWWEVEVRLRGRSP